jgi:4-hydroxy-2-oxoheptanedioate aldolase
VVELAGKCGFDVVWIETEHGAASFETVETLCLAARAGGARACVRVPDAQRCHVLRALDCGADIVVVPMINTPQQAAEIVRHGRFAPLGRRGFNSRTRGFDYGLDDSLQSMKQIDERVWLLAQIETREAVGNCRAILETPGLSGILVGPADLSVDMGRVGQFEDPELIDAVTACIGAARAMGKHAGIVIGPGKLHDAALAAGCDLIFPGSDLSTLATSWQAMRRQQ